MSNKRKRKHRTSENRDEYPFWNSTVPDRQLFPLLLTWVNIDIFAKISLARVIDHNSETGGFTGSWENLIRPAIDEQCEKIVDGIEAWEVHYWSNLQTRPTLQQVEADVVALEEKLKRVNQKYSAQIKYIVQRAGLSDKIQLRHMYHRLMTAVDEKLPLTNSDREEDRGELFKYVFHKKSRFVTHMSFFQ